MKRMNEFLVQLNDSEYLQSNNMYEHNIYVKAYCNA